MKTKLARFTSMAVPIATLGWLYNVEKFPFSKCLVVWAAFVAVYVLTVVSERRK